MRARIITHLSSARGLPFARERLVAVGEGKGFPPWNMSPEKYKTEILNRHYRVFEILIFSECVRRGGGLRTA